MLACFPEFIASKLQSFKIEMHFPPNPKRIGESTQTGKAQNKEGKAVAKKRGTLTQESAARSASPHRRRL